MTRLEAVIMRSTRCWVCSFFEDLPFVRQIAAALEWGEFDILTRRSEAPQREGVTCLCPRWLEIYSPGT